MVAFKRNILILPYQKAQYMKNGYTQYKILNIRLKSTTHQTTVGTAAFEFDILMTAGLCKPCWSHWLGNQRLISCFCGVRQLRFTSPSPRGRMPVYYWSLVSSISLTFSVNQRSFVSWFLNLFCESFRPLLLKTSQCVIYLPLKNFLQSRQFRNVSITLQKVNTINMFVDAVVWACLCVCRLLGLRDSAVNIVQQTLMKRQETETCWQTSSAPTAGIRFYLETDVMVIDTGVQPPARHSRYRFSRDIFQSNQRAVKSLLCECSELQGPLTGLLSPVKLSKLIRLSR